MYSPIITTKKTNGSYLAWNVIVNLSIYLLICFWCCGRAEELYDTYIYRSSAEALIMFMLLYGVVEVLSFIYHGVHAATYAEVYEDRISGTALNGWQMQNFYLEYSKINDISTSTGFLGLQSNPGVFLVISTASGNLKVLTSKDRAASILRYYKENIQK